ncbi:MAG TPA: hypothetical protein VGR45_07075 [Stellaceae bacterium]|nr:hypothetical protein [Stellaceae bacterium]
MWGLPLQVWQTVVLWANIVALAGGILTGAALFVSAWVSSNIADVVQQEADQRISEARTKGDEARADAAKANLRASEAAERAAALEKEAAETRLQYEKLKAAVAWRIIEPDNIKRLVNRLLARPSVVRIEYLQGDPEAQRLAAQLLEAFRDAKWNPQIMARVYLGAPSGVWVLPNATLSDSTRLSVSTVQDAFASIGLGFESQGGPAAELVPGETWGPSSPPVKVIVGAKPEPAFP